MRPDAEIKCSLNVPKADQKSSHSIFTCKCFQNSPNRILYFWLLLYENLSPRNFKNRPIWSHWTADVLMSLNLSFDGSLFCYLRCSETWLIIHSWRRSKVRPGDMTLFCMQKRFSIVRTFDEERLEQGFEAKLIHFT